MIYKFEVFFGRDVQVFLSVFILTASMIELVVGWFKGIKLGYVLFEYVSDWFKLMDCIMSRSSLGILAFCLEQLSKNWCHKFDIPEKISFWKFRTFSKISPIYFLNFSFSFFIVWQMPSICFMTILRFYWFICVLMQFWQ